MYDAEKRPASDLGDIALGFTSERVFLRVWKGRIIARIFYETIQETLTLLSYRPFILMCAIDP